MNKHDEMDSKCYLGLFICPSRAEFYFCGNEIRLTRGEAKLMNMFLSNPQQIFSRELCLYALASDGEKDTRVVDVYIKNIRKKITTEKALALTIIKSERGLGYRLWRHADL